MATCSFMITNLSLSNPHAHVLILRATSCGLSGFIILKYLSGTSGYGSTDYPISKGKFISQSSKCSAYLLTALKKTGTSILICGV